MPVMRVTQGDPVSDIIRATEPFWKDMSCLHAAPSLGRFNLQAAYGTSAIVGLAHKVRERSIRTRASVSRLAFEVQP